MHVASVLSQTAGPTRPFSADEYRGRLERVLAVAAAEPVEALLVQDGKTLGYLTGIETSNGLLVVEPGQPLVFFTDPRYLEAATQNPPGIPVEAIQERKKLLPPLAERRRWRRVGFEESISIRAYRELQEALPEIELVPMEKALLKLRAVKSPAEILRMRTSAAVCDRILEQVHGEIAPGMTEWEIMVAVRRRIVEQSQGEAFGTIVAAGANSSKPHHKTGLAVLQPDDLLLIDMGAVVDGYNSDITRTVFYGRPDPLLAEIHRIVLETNRLAIAAIKPGVVSGELHQLACRHIESYGYTLPHGLGHGLGLGQDNLYCNSAPGVPLVPGMVFTIEPGIYLPGRGGVRIEDMVLVTETGCEVLTQTRREP